jgi:hypothetical protein
MGDRIPSAFWWVAVLCCALPAPGQETGASRPAGAADEALRQPRAFLLAEFEGLLARPKQYAAKVAAECRRLPEGDLFPYVLPAMAYTNLAVADPKRHQGRALRRVPQLIDAAIRPVVRRVRPPAGDLLKLRRFNRHAVYLGNLNLALGCHRLIGGDDRYERLHAHLSKLQRDALAARGGRPLESYPDLTWTFDTIPCLVSLRLRDVHTGRTDADELIRRHLAWSVRRATDPQLGLPYSQMPGGRRRRPVSPRGCELSLRIALLAQLDTAHAAALYRHYVRWFWVDAGALAGFAEWPAGRAGGQDLDSGPILLGIGGTATSFGIATTRAMGDVARCHRLARQMPRVKPLLSAMIRAHPKQRRALTLGGLIDPAGPYYSGFLFGDACLFYAVTYTKWERPLKAATPKEASPPSRRGG